MIKKNTHFLTSHIAHLLKIIQLATGQSLIGDSQLITTATDGYVY